QSQRGNQGKSAGIPVQGEDAAFGRVGIAPTGKYRFSTDLLHGPEFAVGTTKRDLRSRQAPPRPRIAKLGSATEVPSDTLGERSLGDENWRSTGASRPVVIELVGPSNRVGREACPLVLRREEGWKVWSPGTPGRVI